MVKFADRAKGIQRELPKMCGVHDCSEPVAVLVGYNNIPRCARHYQKDIDIYSGKRKSASAFVYDLGMPRTYL